MKKITTLLICLFIYSCSNGGSQEEINNDINPVNEMGVLSLSERAGTYLNNNLVIEINTNGNLILLENTLTSIRGLPLRLLTANKIYKLGEPDSTNTTFTIPSEVVLEANYVFRFPSETSSDIMIMEGGNLMDLFKGGTQTLTNE